MSPLTLLHSLQALLDGVQDYCRQYGEHAVEVVVRLQSGRTIRHPVPTAQTPAVPPERLARAALAPARHSVDFRSVAWFGTDYTFTAGQAACVRVLWEAWENGTPEVSQAAILEGGGSSSDALRAIFFGHPAWGTFIVAGCQKGGFRLAEPSAADADATES